MKKINFKTDVLPHLIAVVLFYVVTIAFFSPVILENKVLPQHDIKMAAGGSAEVREYYDETGEVSLWTNSMFGGMPSYLLGAEYTGELIVHIHVAMGLFLPHPVRLLFIAFVCCYIMLISMGVRPWLATAGAFAFGFTDFLIIGLMAGHNAKIAAVAFMPLVFAGIYLAFNRKLIWGFILTALGLALELRANHLQITYYLLIIVVFYGAYQLVLAFQNKTLPTFGKTLGVLVVAALIALGCNLGRIWTVMEYSQFTMRGKTELTNTDNKSSGLEKDYAFQYSNGIFEPLFLYIPNFYGGSMSEDLGNGSNLEKAFRQNGAGAAEARKQVQNAPAYWGPQPSSAPYYAGAITVFLFVLSIMVLDRKYMIWVVAASALGIMLSWGSNFGAFNYFVFDYLPGYNKFRSVTFTIIIPVFCMILAGFPALEKVLSNWDKDMQKKFLIAVGVAGGFALLCVLLAGIGSYRGAVDERLPEWYAEALRMDRASLLRSDALRSLFFVLVFATVVWFFMKQKLSALVAGILMSLLVLVDMFGVSKRFINSDTFKRKRTEEVISSPADKVILKDKDPNYRVFNLANPFNDGNTSFFHKSIGGYHGAKMQRYQDLIEHAISPDQAKIIGALRSGSTNFSEAQVVNMLNAKYIKFGNEANAVVPNTSANGNAWFVSDVLAVNSPDEEIEAVKTLNTKVAAVVDQSKFQVPGVQYDSLAAISLTEYKPNRLTYQTKASSEGLAVFSEIYYPKGWKAYIDGKETEILRANYVLRALTIAAGEHEVVFEFKPTSYHTGNMVSWVFNILLILLLLGGVGYSLKDEKG